MERLITRRQFLNRAIGGLAALVSGSQIAFSRNSESVILDNMPSEFDWRNYQGKNWMTPVKNKKNLGVCGIFAAVGAVESNIKRDLNNPNINPDLSEQYAINKLGKLLGGSVVDIPTETVLNYIRDYGVPDEACMPYKGDEKEYPICSDYQNRLTKISSWSAISDESWFNYDIAKNREETKKAIIERGPLVTHMHMGEQGIDGTFMNNFGTDGIYRNSVVKVGHYVVFAGYKDTGNINSSYWVVKNDMGELWGFDKNGYFKVGWDMILNGKIYDQGYILEKRPISINTGLAPILKDTVNSLQISTGKSVSGAKDVTGDGKINLMDAILSLQKAKGLR